MRRIAVNAGQDGSVIVQEVKAGDSSDQNYGYDALRGEFGDMVAKGIIDPAKVTRSALENAVSIAGMVLTTNCLVTDMPEKSAVGAGAAPPMY
jgi:chaperonin GroEL